MRTYAVVNQKGGCGKTTTAINLAGVFAGRGYRTLLVDMDPQGHCAAGLAIPEQRVDLNIGDAMLAPDDKPVDPQRLLWRVSRNLDLAPATVRLAALEAARGELAEMPDKDERLKKVLGRFNAQYDVCLIDCSPSIGMLAFNAIVAADEVLIPVETGFFSLQGATKQINTIKSIGKRLGVAPHHRLLATMHDPSSMLSRDLLEELKRRFAGRVIPVVITHDHALREAASFGQPVVEYSRDSQGARDYQQLADWLIEHTLKSGKAATEAVVESAPAPAQRPAIVHDTEPTPIAPSEPERPLVEVVAGTALASAEPLAFAAPAPTLSRAEDMARRTRKLHRAAQIAEAKPQPAFEPARDPFAMPAFAQARTVGSAATNAASTVHSPTSPAPAPFVGESPVATIAPPPAETPRRLFGVQATSRGVFFAQPLTIGQSVAVAGEFNEWTPERTPLRANPVTGALEAQVALAPGFWQYRLVVDGRWMPDPFNPLLAPNPFGGSNSVVVVPLATSDGPQIAARSVG